MIHRHREILEMKLDGYSASEVSQELARRGRPMSTTQIMRICNDYGFKGAPVLEAVWRRRALVREGRLR